MERLDAAVSTLLRSGVAITSVQQAVEELVLNAVDAVATCVAVRVDVSAGRVQVIDNGTGITHHDLDRVSERYTTSKCHNIGDLANLQHFGYRGEALASIRDICLLLEIESRSKTSARTFSRQFKNGQSLGVTQESKEPRSCAGTTVTVYDLFNRLPVRKKALNESLELERCRQRLEALALIHPSLSFSMRNDATAQIVLQTHKSNSMLGSFTHLFGVSRARHLCEVTNTSDQFTVDGYVSKEGCSTKNLQFVYINNRLVLKTKIHKYVNFCLSRSRIGQRRGSQQGDTKSRNVTGSPQKQPEKHGIYVLNIKCALSEYDITFDPTKTLVEFKAWPVVLDCVNSAVGEFLVRENLVNKEEDSSSSSEDEQILDVEISKPLNDSDSEEALSKPSKYAAGISVFDIENALHSKVARRPVNHVDTFKESFDDILPAHAQKEPSERDTDEYHVSETPDQPITKPEFDTMDIRPSQFNIVNTVDIPGNSRANATQPHRENPSKPNIHHATVSRDHGDHGEPLVSTSKTQGLSNDFQTPYNPIPALSLSQLLPTLSGRPHGSPGVRDRTFVSLTTSEEIMTDSAEVASETPSILAAETSQKADTLSRIEAFKAAFSQAKTQGSQGHAHVTLAPLQRMRQRLIAKAQRRQASQETSVQAEDVVEEDECAAHVIPAAGHFKKHSDPGKHKNPSLRKRSADDFITILTESTNESQSKDHEPKRKAKESQSSESRSKQTELNETDMRTKPDLSSSSSSLSSFRSAYAATNTNLAQNMISRLQKLRQNLVGGRLVNVEPYAPTASNTVARNPPNCHDNRVALDTHRRHEVLKSHDQHSVHDNPISHDSHGVHDKAKLHVAQSDDPNKAIAQNVKRPPNVQRDFALDFDVQPCDGVNHARFVTFNALDLFKSPPKNPIRKQHEGHMRNASPTVQALDIASCNDRKRHYVTKPGCPSLASRYNRAQDRESKVMRLSQCTGQSAPRSQSFLSSEDLIQSLHKFDFFNKRTGSRRRSLDDGSRGGVHDEMTSGVMGRGSLTAENNLHATYDNQGREKTRAVSSSVENRARSEHGLSADHSTSDRVMSEHNTSSYFSSQSSRREGLVNRFAHLLEDTPKCDRSKLGFRHMDDLDEGSVSTSVNDHNGQCAKQGESSTDTATRCNSTRNAEYRLHSDDLPAAEVRGFDQIQKSAERREVGILSKIVSVKRKSDMSEVYQREESKTEEAEKNPTCSVAETYPASQGFPVEESQGFATARSTEELTQAFDVTCWTPDKESCQQHEIQIPEIPKIPEPNSGNNSRDHLTHEDAPPPPSSNERRTGTNRPGVKKKRVDAGGFERPAAVPECSGVTDGDHQEHVITEPQGKPPAPNVHQQSASLETSNSVADGRTTVDMEATSRVEPHADGTSYHDAKCINVLSVESEHQIWKDISPNDMGREITAKGTVKETSTKNAVKKTSIQDTVTDTTNGTVMQTTKATGMETATTATYTETTTKATGMETATTTEPATTQKTATQMPAKPRHVTSSTAADVLASSSSSVPVTETPPTALELRCEAVTDLGGGGEMSVRTPPRGGHSEAARDWITQIDSNTGQTIYINKVSGNSSFVAPCVPTEDSPDTAAELVKVPYGLYGNNASTFLSSRLSSIVSAPSAAAGSVEVGRMLTDHLRTVHAQGLEKWGEDGPPPQLQEKTDVKEVITRMWNEWENPMFKNPQVSCISAERSKLPRNASRVHQLVHPFTFTTDMFSRIKVLGQMDNKFITCMLLPGDAAAAAVEPRMLVVVDQHAAHERVRLESFTQAAYEGDSSRRLKASLVAPPMVVPLPASTIRVMEAYAAYFDRIGVRFTSRSDGGGGGGGGTVSIQTLPSCLLDAEATEARKTKPSVPFELVETLLKEQVEVVEESHGGDITLPRTIHHRLCSQACHGAIKFGDPLSVAECERLIVQLSSCRLPFQCAHGRPAIMPLLNMDHLTLNTRQRTSAQNAPKPRIAGTLFAMMEQRKRSQRTESTELAGISSSESLTTGRGEHV